MLVRVLGDLEVVRDGGVLPLGGPKPRTLLGLLVAAGGRTVATDRLIDQLWGDAPPPRVLAAMQVYVAKLRRRLEPARGPRERPTLLVTRPSGYALVLPDGAVDAGRFEALVTRAASMADPGAAEPLLEEALGLWRGSAYAGLGDAPLLAAEGRRLEEVRDRAVEQLWAVRLDRGAHEDCVGALGALVEGNPSRERLWALLVLALYRSGRQAEALDALRRVRAHLSDELGLDPGPELRRLEEAVLRQDEALLLPQRRPRPEVATAAPADGPGPGPPGAVHGVRSPGPATEGLAGREEPLALTRRLVTEAAAGTGRVLLVTGEPGIGKTRFADAVAEQAEAAGLRRAWGTWEAEGCPPLWGWTRALGERGRAAFAAAADGEEDIAAATVRLAETTLQLLTRDGGACLVLDDVQWADADSLRLVSRVADLAGGAPVLMVVLCREPAAEGAPATQAMLAALARCGAERVALRGLAAGAVRAAVQERTGVTVTEAMAERIRARTDGNPFYVTELVRLLVEEGALSDLDSPAWRSVPHGVRDTVHHRLGELLPTVGEALSAAAVFGRTVDLDLLEAHWQGEPEQLDEALDTALAAGLVAEDGAGRIRFGHALVRDAVYARLSPLARRRWHARAAETIERCRIGRLDEHAVALAEHHRLAGPAHTRAAWSWSARAARLAAATGAHADAARLLGAAAELQAGDPLAVPEERESVHVAWGEALRRSGRISLAWAPLRTAAESALGRGDGRAAARALLVVTEHVLWSWRTAHAADEDAVALWQRVVAALPPSETGLRARCLAALTVEVMHDPPGGRCTVWADEALALARRDGDDAVRVDVLHTVVNALRRPDLLPRRVPAADELVALCVRRGDERSLAVALCKRALNHSAYARPDAALADLRRALALAERHRVAPAQMVVHLGLAVLHQAAGDRPASEAALRAAEAVQSTLSMAGTGLAGTIRATALLPEGRLADAEVPLRAAARIHPAFRDLHALALLAAAGPERVRADLGPWREQPPMTWDYLWVSHAVLRALVWAELGDPEAVADLRRQLEPFADRIADGAMAALFLGSVRHALGVLALAAGDHQAASTWAREARDLHRRLGWAPWERLSQALLDRVPPPVGR